MWAACCRSHSIHCGNAQRWRSAAACHRGSSPGELEPVFETILVNALRICEANVGNLWLYDGEAFRDAALQGATHTSSGAAANRSSAPARTLRLPALDGRNRWSTSLTIRPSKVTSTMIRSLRPPSNSRALGPWSQCRCSRITNSTVAADGDIAQGENADQLPRCDIHRTCKNKRAMFLDR